MLFRSPLRTLDVMANEPFRTLDVVANEPLRTLDVMANEPLRITSGAFKTTSVSSLQVLNNEAPLELRRVELLLKYYYKLKCYLRAQLLDVWSTAICTTFSTIAESKAP